MKLFDTQSIISILSTIALTIICIMPSTKNLFPIWVINMALHIADTMFHEVGHSLFAWLTGSPSIPSIFTIFGREHAGGMAMRWERSWIIQCFAYAAMFGAGHWLYHHARHLFWYFVSFSIIVIIFSLTQYYDLPLLYMGHGSSILMGGFFLYRGFVYMDSRNAYERWLNALIGSYLALFNIHFGYQLAFDPFFLSEYVGHTAPGAGKNDFVKIADIFYSWTVAGIGLFTMCLGIFTILLSAAFALYETWNDYLNYIDDADH